MYFLNEDDVNIAIDLHDALKSIVEINFEREWNFWHFIEWSQCDICYSVKTVYQFSYQVNSKPSIRLLMVTTIAQGTRPVQVKSLHGGGGGGGGGGVLPIG